jgi:hypothetical protein
MGLQVREEADEDRLFYFPREAESMLWEAILFIEGIDL